MENVFSEHSKNVGLYEKQCLFRFLLIYTVHCTEIYQTHELHTKYRINLGKVKCVRLEIEIFFLNSRFGRLIVTISHAMMIVGVNMLIFLFIDKHFRTNISMKYKNVTFWSCRWQETELIGNRTWRRTDRKKRENRHWNWCALLTQIVYEFHSRDNALHDNNIYLCWHFSSNDWRFRSVNMNTLHFYILRIENDWQEQNFWVSTQKVSTQKVFQMHWDFIEKR